MGWGRFSEPTRVGTLLGAVVPQLADRMLEVQIRREWRSLVGTEIARRCQPGELRGGILQLVVDNSPWLQELALREAELLSRLTERYGGGTVRSLRFSIGVLTPDAAAPDRRRAGSHDRPTDEERSMIEAAVMSIPDPDLQARARRLLERACVAARRRDL
jgi:hypothetical protein